MFGNSKIKEFELAKLATYCNYISQKKKKKKIKLYQVLQVKIHSCKLWLKESDYDIIMIGFNFN